MVEWTTVLFKTQTKIYKNQRQYPFSCEFEKRTLKSMSNNCRFQYESIKPSQVEVYWIIRAFLTYGCHFSLFFLVNVPIYETRASWSIKLLIFGVSSFFDFCDRIFSIRITCSPWLLLSFCKHFTHIRSGRLRRSLFFSASEKILTAIDEQESFTSPGSLYDRVHSGIKVNSI